MGRLILNRTFWSSFAPQKICCQHYQQTRNRWCWHFLVVKTCGRRFMVLFSILSFFWATTGIESAWYQEFFEIFIILSNYGQRGRMGLGASGGKIFAIIRSYFPNICRYILSFLPINTGNGTVWWDLRFWARGVYSSINIQPLKNLD